jgi:DNA-binding beta-propeller fold protein YncE
MPFLAAAFLLAPLAAPPRPRADAAAGYRIVDTLKLGGEGGWDYLTLDPDSRRLFVSRGTHVMVLDADTGRVLGDIPDTPGVHGIAIARDLGRGFISNGRSATATIFDLQTLGKVGEVKTGQNPDAILYDPASKRVFTFNGRSADATAFDAAQGAVAGTIPLGGKPEFAVADGKGRIYVNVEDTSEIVALDSKDLQVRSRWPLKACEEPSGLAFDAEHARLFSVCSNRLMAVVDSGTGRVITTLPIGDGVDGAAFDPATGLAFSSNGEGTLTVVHEDSPDSFRVVENVPTRAGARTMTLDPKTHRLFLSTADLGPRPSPTAEVPRPRASVVLGSFVILVLDRGPGR